METFEVEGLYLSAENRLKARMELLDEKLKALKEICSWLYRVHSYNERGISNEEYKANWKEARRLCAEIKECEWSEEKTKLDTYKALACYYIGTVYVEKMDYDVALSYLKQARELIEVQSAQYILMECYVGSCIGMAKCYIEKHSPSEVIEECHQRAGEVLEREGRRTGRKDARYWKQLLELRLQQAIAELDMYGQKKQFDREQACRMLQEAERLIKRISVKDVADPKWMHKQEITLITTKGDYYKKLYFDLSDEEILKWKSNSRVWIRPEDIGQETEGNNIKPRLLEAAFKQFAMGVRLEKENTICLGSMAALLYDAYGGGDKEKEECLMAVLKRYADHGDNLSECTMPDIIDRYLDAVIEIEHNNMFALNLKAALKEDGGKSNEQKHYPALRQSSLKRRFADLATAIGTTAAGTAEEKRKEDAKKEYRKSLMMNLILLHNKASEFMNKAIINFGNEDENEEWKDLIVGHYTRLDVLPKLINKNADSKLRIQNVHHLNDPLEGVLFVRLLNDAVKKEHIEGEPVLKELMELYSSEKIGTVRNSVYMGSFTGRLDQLNMWSQYGDGGRGCSLQIHSAETFDSSASVSLAEISGDDSTHVFRMEDTRYPLYMVIYLPAGKEIDLEAQHKYAEKRAEMDGDEKRWWKMQARLIKELAVLQKDVVEILKRIGHDFEELSKNLDEEHRKSTRSELCNCIMVILDLVRFLIKSDYYSDEREYRIIQYSSDPQFDPVDSGIPKLYIQMEKKIEYEKVCFGPLVQNFDSLAAYVLNIKKTGREGEAPGTWNIKVCKSDIDYR